MPYTYKDAGVDINKVRDIQKNFARLLASTFDNKVISGFGHYAGLYAINDEIIAMHTDGVGSKVMIAQMLNRFNTIGIDCIAMNANDIICVGAKPLAFVDYLMLKEANEYLIKEIMKGLIKGARESNVSIIGGETAIMPDLLHGDNSFDLAGSMIGIVKKDEVILGEKIKIGDAIIGLESTGLHSNGYTLARKVLLKEYRLDEKIKGLRSTLGLELLRPTAIYVKPILALLEKHRENIHGMAHITGGAFSKLRRLTRYRFDIKIDYVPSIFKLIQEHASINEREMLRTFNMGIGFCIVIEKGYVDEVISLLKRYGVKSRLLGYIREGRGIYVNSIKID
ncbi:MAG: phosphoribosylformylglycinamidine cyclo-ligase [Candidatus Nitrosocaldaceae archaeon]